MYKKKSNIDLTDEQVNEFFDNGYIVIKNYLKEEEVCILRKKIREEYLDKQNKNFKKKNRISKFIKST